MHRNTRDGFELKYFNGKNTGGNKGVFSNYYTGSRTVQFHWHVFTMQSPSFVSKLDLRRLIASHGPVSRLDRKMQLQVALSNVTYEPWYTMKHSGSSWLKLQANSDWTKFSLAGCNHHWSIMCKSMMSYDVLNFHFNNHKSGWVTYRCSSQSAQLSKCSDRPTHSVCTFQTVLLFQLWMGTHPKGPSMVSGSQETLSEWISRNPMAVGKAWLSFP